MSKHEQDIRNAVSLRGTVSVLELSEMLGVSDQTIRRIVKPMVERGEVRKVHGAIVSTRNPIDPPYLARMNHNRQAKVAIARAVAELVRNGDSLALDTGSTSGFVAQALRARRDLIIVTNSAFVASTLSMIEGNRVFMAGTQLRDHDGAAFDRSAFEVIDRFQADHAILSASMVDPVRGFLVHEQCEVDIATAMMAIADRSIMAVDHSKFEPQTRRPTLSLPSLSKRDLLVTSRAPAGKYMAMLSDLTIHVARPRGEGAAPPPDQASDPRHPDNWRS